MNKQRYLAELERLLVFMTAEDREATVRRYGAMFDEAGPEGEETLVERIGSPTKVAIGLSRDYEPGSLSVEEPEPVETAQTEEPPQEEASQEEQVLPPEEQSEPAVQSELAAMERELMLELPVFDLPGLDLSAPETPAAEDEDPADPAEEPPQEGAPAAPAEEVPQEDAPVAPAEEAPQEDAPAAPVQELPQEEAPAAPAQEASPKEQPAVLAKEMSVAPAQRPESKNWRTVPLEDGPKSPAQSPAAAKEEIVRTVPLGVGIPLFVLSVLLLGVPLGLLSVGVAIVLLCPGAACLVAAWLVFVGGLWCISYIADAILMFGLAFLVLSFGILVLWCGFWLGFQLVRLYISFIRSLSGLLLGKKVDRYA